VTQDSNQWLSLVLILFFPWKVGNLFQTNVILTEFLLALQIIVFMDVTSHRLIVRYISDEPCTVFITNDADYTVSNPGRHSYQPLLELEISLGAVRWGCMFQGTMCEVQLSCGTPERQGRSPSQVLEGRQEDPDLNYRAVLLSGLRTKTAILGCKY
jgi:hypothetical protein